MKFLNFENWANQNILVGQIWSRDHKFLTSDLETETETHLWPILLLADAKIKKFSQLTSVEISTTDQSSTF
jgi:hypothetical protein